jgi:hypothetical protein
VREGPAARVEDFVSSRAAPDAPLEAPSPVGRRIVVPESDPEEEEDPGVEEVWASAAVPISAAASPTAKTFMGELPLVLIDSQRPARTAGSSARPGMLS